LQSGSGRLADETNAEAGWFGVLYDYVMVYVDDIFAIEIVPQNTMAMPSRTYNLKDRSVKDSDKILTFY
jgi:hypothetical protein